MTFIVWETETLPESKRDELGYPTYKVMLVTRVVAAINIVDIAIWTWVAKYQQWGFSTPGGPMLDDVIAWKDAPLPWGGTQEPESILDGEIRISFSVFSNDTGPDIEYDSDKMPIALSVLVIVPEGDDYLVKAGLWDMDNWSDTWLFTDAMGVPIEGVLAWAPQAIIKYKVGSGVSQEIMQSIPLEPIKPCKHCNGSGWFSVGQPCICKY